MNDLTKGGKQKWLLYTGNGYVGKFTHTLVANIYNKWNSSTLKSRLDQFVPFRVLVPPWFLSVLVAFFALLLWLWEAKATRRGLDMESWLDTVRPHGARYGSQYNVPWYAPIIYGNGFGVCEFHFNEHNYNVSQYGVDREMHDYT